MTARVILLIFGVTVFMLALRRLRAYRIKERHFILFVFMGLPFLLLAIWPWGIGWIAQKLQIEYQTVSILCVVAFLILMVVELLTIVSLQDRKISTLAQTIGIIMAKHGISGGGGDVTAAAPPDEPEAPQRPAR